MAVDLRFVAAGAKRVFDSRPMYAQIVVTDDCNLNCAYCAEYTPGAPIVPLKQLKERINKLDDLGVRVYDLFGGEPLLHPGLSELVRHIKSKRHASNLVTVITNGFLLTKDKIRGLNDAGLDFMQVSVDSVAPTALSPKSLKSVLPRLRLLAKEAKFQVEIQTVLNDETYQTYDQFRDMLRDFPFAFGFSIMHAPGGHIAIRGEKFLDLLSKHGVFEGVNYYGEHLKEMLLGDFSRSWKCLAGFKYLYVNAKGAVQWCAQQRDYARPLEEMGLAELRGNNCHKPCESGCSQNCVRMVSQMLGESLTMMRASLRIALDMRKGARTPSCTPS
jgi:MoaA/NifB/PqqE/SkfB family radical SAM enzyme